MDTFRSIQDLLNALAQGKELLGEMFGKRKTFNYRYDHAVEVVDEKRVNLMIDQGILIKNGPYLEIEDQLLSFFEQVMDVNEEISVALIDEHLKQLHDNMDYYLTEDSEHRKHKYLKSIKSALRKLGAICIRNIVDLNRNIDDAFKTEPNFRIKVKKLENYDQRRQDIKQLIAVVDHFLSEDELTFFKTVRDDELSRISNELQQRLHEARHNLIETERQIIDFLNQVRHQSRVIEKIRQVKYLSDQYELESKSNILEVLEGSNGLLFEKRATFPVKLSLDILQEDATHEIIRDLNRKIKSETKVKVPVAAAIDASFFEDTEEQNVFVDLEKMKMNFCASSYHLLDFVMRYEYPMEVSFEDKAAYYCQLISLYENEFDFTENYVTQRETEFSVVYPK